MFAQIGSQGSGNGALHGQEVALAVKNSWGMERSASRRRPSISSSTPAETVVLTTPTSTSR